MRTFAELLDMLSGGRSATRSTADLLTPGLRQRFDFCWHCCRAADRIEVLSNSWRDQIWLVIECHGERLRTEIDVVRMFRDDDYDLSYVRAFDFRSFAWERQAAFWSAVEYSAFVPLIL